ncbi:hypothetical protein [Thermoflavimicrobium daqui]|uniref:Uncharacterized protein n=1 Tax=Thermoflavimicrobium daqui TaxID=2137476 RepID=A0A364K2B8_9BACL|nr:hypothetical protein [Thermoflavimicrobium daqui]RAL22562.1 hypothetical protein DL897_14215 [Thermoflavimicrobium daqui]
MGRGDDTPLNLGVVQNGNGLRTLTTQEFHRLQPWECQITVLGETLGYPPKAVSFYVNHWVNLQKDQDQERVNYATHHVGLKYCGINCSSSIVDFTDNIKWFWDTYEQPIAIWVVVDMLKYDMGADFRIPYRDGQELYNVEKTVKSILLQNEMVIRKDIVVASINI